MILLKASNEFPVSPNKASNDCWGYPIAILSMAKEFDFLAHSTVTLGSRRNQRKKILNATETEHTQSQTAFYNLWNTWAS